MSRLTSPRRGTAAPDPWAPPPGVDPDELNRAARAMGYGDPSAPPPPPAARPPVFAPTDLAEVVRTMGPAGDRPDPGSALGLKSPADADKLLRQMYPPPAPPAKMIGPLAWLPQAEQEEVVRAHDRPASGPAAGPSVEEYDRMYAPGPAEGGGGRDYHPHGRGTDLRDALTAQPDPSQMQPRSLWETMNSRATPGGPSLAELVQVQTGAAYGQTPLSFDPAVVVRAFAQQQGLAEQTGRMSLDQMNALLRQSNAEADRALEGRKLTLQFDPARLREQSIDQIIAAGLAAGKPEAEIGRMVQDFRSIKGRSLPADPTMPPQGRPGGGTYQPGGAAPPGGNPYNAPLGDTDTALQLYKETLPLLTPKDKDGVIGREDMEKLLNSYAARQLTPAAEGVYMETLLKDVKNMPAFLDALAKAGAKAATNANLPYEFRPGAYSPPQLPGLTLKPAETAGLNFWRTMLAGFNDAGAYRTAEFGGRQVPLDVGDVSNSAFATDADRQQAAARLAAIEAFRRHLQQRGMANFGPPAGR